jgi:ketosteroid isomerase-like protein
MARTISADGMQGRRGMANTSHGDSEGVSARIARLEAYEAIRQLAARYALAIDMRDIDALVGLFVDDGRNVFFTPDESGTPGGQALRARYNVTQRGYTNSLHTIHQHIIDLDDQDHAHGIVYARCEQEIEDHTWTLTAFQYWDRYERVEDRWLIAERRAMPWYFTPWQEPPVGARKMRWIDRPHEEAGLPHAWPSWGRFWADGAPVAVGASDDQGG